ncbi:MAG: SUF system Fe-S cluster assembly protein [Planctomycetes bacterium]|nr:SUF system Fe-S cluster assembly protein [Planctomycetota bacterium]
MNEETPPDSHAAAPPDEDRVIRVLKTVFDPEIPVDIHELGLIYGIDISDAGQVVIRMTLTSPNCPAAESMPGEVQMKVRALDGVEDVDVQIVWDPPWTPERMSEAARLELGMW